MVLKTYNPTQNINSDYYMLATSGNITLLDGGTHVNGKGCLIRIPQEDGRTFDYPASWIKFDTSLDYEVSKDNDIYLFRLFDITFILINTNTPPDVASPVLSGFLVETANPQRILFDSDEFIVGTTFGGFVVSDKTITAIHVEPNALTGHYLDVNADFVEGDSPTISSDGIDIEDVYGNKMASFGATAITNNVDNPDITVASVENAAPFDFVFTAERAITGTTAGWTPKINGVAATKTGFAGSGTTTITITVSETVLDTDILTFDYSGGDMVDQYGNVMQTIIGQAVTNDVGAEYTFANTQQLLVDAADEGVTVINANCYPSDGAGNDSDISISFWYKTPATIGATKNLIRIWDSNDLVLPFITIQRTATNTINARFTTDATNFLLKTTSNTISANTLYLITITKTGEAFAGIKIYINNAEAGYAADGSGGSYTGLYSIVGNLIVDIGASLGANEGLGMYQVYWQFNAVLSLAQVQVLYNAGTPTGLTVGMQSQCVQENLFEGNANADNIGMNGTTEGGATYIAV